VRVDNRQYQLCHAKKSIPQSPEGGGLPVAVILDRRRGENRAQRLTAALIPRVHGENMAYRESPRIYLRAFIPGLASRHSRLDGNPEGVHSRIGVASYKLAYWPPLTKADGSAREKAFCH
jgi:hypothetical protein